MSGNPQEPSIPQPPKKDAKPGRTSDGKVIGSLSIGNWQYSPDRVKQLLFTEPGLSNQGGFVKPNGEN